MSYLDARKWKNGSEGQVRHKILIVDDSEMNRMVLSQILSDEFDCVEACDGTEAIAYLREHEAELSLVLLDIVMPKLDGFGVLSSMNIHQWLDSLPVVVISGETGNDYVRRAYEMGATDYISRPFDAVIVHRRVNNTIKLYDRQKKLAMLATDQLYKREKSNRIMINILSHIVEQRNSESGLHVLHINLIAEILAKRLVQKTKQYPMSREDIAILRAASSLHDIGKLGIPEEVLNKPGRLTQEEFQIVKKHSMIGADMLGTISVYQDEPLVRMSYEVCRWHHERWDGGGYPDGLKGDQIPIAAQIVSLADVYDALTGERVYKKAFSHEEAVQMILNGECGCFNPILLECFLDVQDKLRQELKGDTLNRKEDRAIQHAMIDELLQHEELTMAESALRLLEYERNKHRAPRPENFDPERDTAESNGASEARNPARTRKETP